MKQMLSFLFALSFCIVSYAQESQNEVIDKNEFGFELTDLIDGAVQLKYERLLNENITIGMGIGYKGVDGLIRLSGIDTDQIKTGDITYTGFKIISEVRYYINKTGVYGMDGFYFGAYVKYVNYRSDLDGTYINSSEESFLVEFDADLSVTSIGFMAGYKLPISKKMSIDFLIAGPGRGFHSYTLNNKRDLPDEFYEDLNEALDQYSLFDVLNGDFRFSDTTEKTKFNILSFRYGISIGYSF